MVTLVGIGGACFFGNSTVSQWTIFRFFGELLSNGNTGGTGEVGNGTNFLCEMLIVCLCCMDNVLLVPPIQSNSNANLSRALLVP